MNSLQGVSGNLVLPLLFISTGVVGLALNITFTCLKTTRKKNLLGRGLTAEWKACLLSLDIVFILVSSTSILIGIERYYSVREPDITSPILTSVCMVAGFGVILSMFLLSWMPLSLCVVLCETERYSSPTIRLSKGLNRQMIAVIQVSVFLISAVLTSINYLPLPGADLSR